jgi:chromosome segregation ATPase
MNGVQGKEIPVNQSAGEQIRMEAQLHVLTHRVETVEGVLSKAIVEIRDGIKEIAANTGKLAVLEERHAETRDGLERAFKEIGKCQREHDDTDDRIKTLEIAMPDRAKERLGAIEVAMPGLKETRRWLMAGVFAAVAAVGLALFKMVGL